MRASAGSLIVTFFQKNPWLCVLLGLLSLAAPFDSVITPVLIGRLTQAISDRNFTSTKSNLIMIVIVCIVVLVIYNVDLQVAHVFLCRLIAHLQTDLIECYFRQHSVGSESAVDSLLAHQIHSYSTSMTDLIDVTRNSIFPALASIAFQSIYLFFSVDKQIGLTIGAIFVLMVAAYYVSAFVKRMKGVQEACDADYDVYSHIEDVIDNFSSILATDGATSEEIHHLRDLSAKKLVATRKATRDLIKYTAVVNVVLGALAIFFAWLFYRKFLKPMKENGDSSRNNISSSLRKMQQKEKLRSPKNGKNTPLLQNKKDSGLDQAVTVITIFFDVLITCRSLMYHLFTFTECIEKMRIAEKVFEGEKEEAEEKCLDAKTTAEWQNGSNGGGGGGGKRIRQPLRHIAAAETEKVGSAPLRKLHIEDKTADLYNNEPGGGGALEFRDLSFAYRDSKSGALVPVFSRVSFSVPANRITVLVGRNGSGKTTLFRLALRYAEPTEGSVSLFGQDLKTISSEALRRRVVYASQFASLLDRTVLENILYFRTHRSVNARKDIARGRRIVQDLIRDYDLEGFFASLPNGIDTRVGRRAERLSGGQRQIVQLLRLVFKTSAQVVLLDEISASVDAYHTDLIVKILTKPNSFFSSRTLVLITHNEKFLSIADRVVDLSPEEK